MKYTGWNTTKTQFKQFTTRLKLKNKITFFLTQTIKEGKKKKIHSSMDGRSQRKVTDMAEIAK